MNSKIWLSPPHMSGDEQEFIKNAFATNWIAPNGLNIDNFEKDIKSYLNNKSHVVALSSGTSAVHLALRLLNVSIDDEVICQSKTFVASASPITYLGAKPVFVDSEFKTWNICPILLEKAIKDRISKGNKPKVIIVVNLYGMPYQVDKINAISKKYGIPVIEDAAESFGSTYKNKKCGTLGDISILSFNGNKIITTSTGGALITKTKKLKQRVIHLATQANHSKTEYSHNEVGYNYRMSNVLAGIGRGQMKVLNKYVKARRRNYYFYFKNLKGNPNITFLDEPSNYYSNRWLTCIVLDSNNTRERLRLLLEKNNIESRISWKPMHLQPVFKDAPSYLNGVSENLYRKGLCLPSGSNLTTNDLNRIVNVIQSYFN